ncbi:MFS transporter [Nocardiopsis suaedae]|uniref:MFS transporter n=1 Tax=Nocardiopsis suaedae TaxID=3018444 RepID=A0ABT4THS7_9ACTN|nr:MFS transporter [Nocardiopsis suaedae]MDA2803637.1 MFS transporter [Nocardiopsis suaedae]
MESTRRPTPPQVRRALPGLLLGMLLGAVDQTAIAPALPAVASDLGGFGLMPFVITVYLVAATALMPLYGRLGDRFGRTRPLQAAIALFTAGALAAGQADSMAALLIARAVQGAGGGGVMVGVQSALGELVSPRERGRYLGLFGAVFALAAVGGPLLGGAVTDALGWRWLFHLYPPLGLAALVAVTATLRLPRPTAHRPVDTAGALSLAAAVVGLVVLGSAPGWPGRPDWAVPAAAALLIGGAAAWAVTARRAADPVLPPRLLRDRSVGTAVAVAFLVGSALFGIAAYVPAYVQIALGASASQAGAVMIALMAGVLVTTVASGRMITRTGRYRAYPVVGTAVAAAAMTAMGALGPDSTPAQVAGLLALLGLGLGLVMQVMTLVAQNAAPRADLGAATAAVVFWRQVGASAGAALTGALVNLRFAALLPAETAARVGGASALSPEAAAALPPADRAAVATAFGEALPPLFAWAAPLMGLAVLLCAALPALPLRETAHASDTSPGTGNTGNETEESP